MQPNNPTPDAMVEVTQADRNAVQAFHRVMLDRLMSDVKSKRPKLGDDEGDAGTLVQAFARHRLAALAPPAGSFVAVPQWCPACQSMDIREQSENGGRSRFYCAECRASIRPAADAGSFTEGVEAERAEIVAWLRRQSDLGANRGNEAEKGTTKRAAFGGGSLALKRAADEIESGGFRSNDNAPLTASGEGEA